MRKLAALLVGGNIAKRGNATDFQSVGAGSNPAVSIDKVVIKRGQLIDVSKKETHVQNAGLITQRLEVQILLLSFSFDVRV